MGVKKFGEEGIPLEFMREYLPKDPVIVEAGAKFGTDTIKLCDFWPEGRVYSFEPIPELYKKTIQNVKNHPRIQCFQKALFDHTGKSKIYVSSGRSLGSSSLLPPGDHLTIHPDTFFDVAIDIDTITIDEWVMQEKVKKIDFLWLDTQGTELAIMKGAPQTMKKVRLIHVEVSLKPVYQNTPLYPEVREWLNSMGFGVIAEQLPWSDMGNVIFFKDA